MTPKRPMLRGAPHTVRPVSRSGPFAQSQHAGEHEALHAIRSERRLDRRGFQHLCTHPTFRAPDRPPEEWEQMLADAYIGAHRSFPFEQDKTNYVMSLCAIGPAASVGIPRCQQWLKTAIADGYTARSDENGVDQHDHTCHAILQVGTAAQVIESIPDLFAFGVTTARTSASDWWVNAHYDELNRFTGPDARALVTALRAHADARPDHQLAIGRFLVEQGDDHPAALRWLAALRTGKAFITGEPDRDPDYTCGDIPSVVRWCDLQVSQGQASRVRAQGLLPELTGFALTGVYPGHPHADDESLETRERAARLVGILAAES